MAGGKKKPDLFQYVLIIKKEKPLNIDLISILLCVISFLFFLYYSFVQQSLNIVLLSAGLLVPVVLGYTIWLKRKSNPKANFKHPLLTTAFVWLFVPGLRWFFIFFILFVLFDHQARQPLEIGVSDEKIVINTFFRKRYLWTSFNNVVLKDNLFTLDFKNNKILQKEIEPDATGVNEKEFNLFCMEQILNQQAD
jgi:hypothetical protein